MEIKMDNITPVSGTKIKRLRVLGFLEGISFISLIFIAVPLKHIFGNPILVRIIGPIHGILFLWFLFITLSVGDELKWEFKDITWKVVLSSLIPFGTFYIDRKILCKINN
jgi:integral membrane protein